MLSKPKIFGASPIQMGVVFNSIITAHRKTYYSIVQKKLLNICMRSTITEQKLFNGDPCTENH